MWFDLAVLWGSSKLIWSHLRPHISPQQTTVTAVCDDIDPYEGQAFLRPRSHSPNNDSPPMTRCRSTTLKTAVAVVC